MTTPFLYKIMLSDCGAVFRVAFAVMVFAGCSSLSETSDIYISEQKAIEAALEIASMSHPEMSGAQVEPYNISAQQITLVEAMKKINEKNQVFAGDDPNMIVWFVTMDGLWLGEMSASGVSPTPEPVLYHHYAIILDAKTGLDIESSLSP